MTLRLLQLSDCHLQSNPADNYRGINPEHNLQRCLQAAEAWRPDVLLLSGDLADHATEAAYSRLNDAIARLGITTIAFPGNHDEVTLMQSQLTSSVFQPDNPWQSEHWQIVWLDSNVPEQPHGELDADKLSVLDKLGPDKPVLLALHHQPVEVGTPWIDRLMLSNPEYLWQRLETVTAPIKAITWGHIHHHWSGEHRLDNHTIQLYGAPATSACIQPGSSTFVLDERGPRMRWFLLSESGDVRSGLLSVS